MTSASFEVLHSDRLCLTLTFTLGYVPVQKFVLIPVPNGKKPHCSRSVPRGTKFLR